MGMSAEAGRDDAPGLSAASRHTDRFGAFVEWRSAPVRRSP
ncbi:MAG: hypothetical protein ACP5P9_01030 [Acidimicrobiales bacterium]